MIPLALMLTAGAITSIITYIRDYELIHMLWILVVVLIVFYILGLCIKRMMEAFDEQNVKAQQEEAAKEGAVIEKELSEEEKQNMKGKEENRQ